MIELPRSLQKHATSHKEVFLNRKNYANEIDLETILKTHQVTYTHTYLSLLTHSSPNV